MRLHFNHSLLNGQGTKRIDILLKNKFDNTQKILCFRSVLKKYTKELVSDSYSWACHLKKHNIHFFLGLSPKFSCFILY